MRPQAIRNLLRIRTGWVLALTAAAVLVVGPAAAQAPEPTELQVQYLPRDGAAIVLWNPIAGATGYNVHMQEVGGRDEDTLALKKVNAEPVTTTSLLVENLTNGKAYHFRVSVIADGAESEPVGPTPARTDQGDFVAVVPQKPVKLAGMDGFYGHNIGTDYPGSHEVSETGTITMMASGWDIQLDADGFYFLSMPIKGDITLTVKTVSGPTETANQSQWNLAGPQIRESLDASARFAMQQVAHTGPIQFKTRSEYNQSPVQPAEEDGDPERRPVWLRVVRAKNDFSGFVSDDGTTWKQIGETVTIDEFAEEAYAGLALSSHDNGEYSTVVFEDFTITPTSP